MTLNQSLSFVPKQIDDEVATLPFSLADGKIRVKKRGRFVKIETDLGVALSYDGYHYGEVRTFSLDGTFLCSSPSMDTTMLR